MAKLKTLTNNLLKELLRMYELDTTGNKTDLILRLTEYLGCDEISDSVLNDINVNKNDQIQTQIDSLRAMMENVVKVVTDMQRPAENHDITVVPENRSVFEQRSESTPIVATTRYSISEIMAMLPEFNTTNGSMTSQQFINKVTSLRSVYGWAEEALLYAVQGKLLGHAKTWVDGQGVFQSWEEFSTALIADFPSECNMADEHLAMARTRQGKNENMVEYYYKMLSKGRCAKMDDRSIIRHIINGISDENIRRTCNANNFVTCSELLRAINGMETTTFTTRTSTEYNYKPKDKNTQKFGEKGNINSGQKGVTCYNCGGGGHISRNCSQPQKRERCARCDKVHRRGQTTCEASVHRIEVMSKKNNIFERNVMIAGEECSAYVDTGSECHLIRKTIISKLQLQPVPCGVELSGLWGGRCLAKEKVKANVKIDEFEFEDMFLVVNDDVLSTDLLLGRSIFELNGANIQITADGLTINVEKKVMRTNVDLSKGSEEGVEMIAETECTEAKTKIFELLEEFNDIFSSGLTNIGKTDLIEMKIELTTNDVVRHKPYRVPEPKKADVNRMIKEMLENDIIEESTSDYASPMILVKKKNGSDRLCVDYRMLNKITRREVFPTPNIEELLQEAKQYKYYSSLDLNSGYYQIVIEPNSRKFTSFITINGLFQFKRMPFGLMNAPAVFQRLMEKLREKLPEDDFLFYMDDILVGANTEEEMLNKLRRVFSILREHKLTLNLGKCTFMVDTVQFLGHQLTPNGIKPGELKVNVINDYPQPENVTEVRRFLGLSGYFRKFIPAYAVISEPIRRLLKKNQPFTWNEEQINAFENLKRLLITSPVLVGYRADAEHELHTDASKIGIAAVLMQREAENVKPVAYYSRSTTENESKYHSYELETLAVVEALERFRYYIYGKPIKVITDCNAVTTLMSKRELIPRISRWWLKVQDYDIQLEHRAEQRMHHVDALSRAPVEESHEVDVVSMRIGKINITNEDWMFSMQMQDEKLREINQKLERKDPATMNEYAVENGRLFRKIKEKKVWVVPKGLRWRIIHDNHDLVGHLSVEKTIERVAEHFWFPRLRNFVKSYIKSCPDCAFNKGKGQQSGVEYHYDEIDPVPFKIVHMDHLGPFPMSKKRNQHLLVIIDAFTKYVVIKAVRNTSTKFVIDTMNEMISYVGPPEMLVTDRGTAYTSKEFQRFCEKNNIKHRLNAVRTPRANGQVERSNRTILSMMTTMTKEDKCWDENIRTIQWALNTMKHSVTGFTPQQLLFNFKPRDTLQNKLIQALYTGEIVNEDEVQNIREEAAKRINESRRMNKKRFDSKQKKPKKYNVGDFVLVENEKPSIGHSRKLEPRYKGPFMITKDLGKDRYVVEDLPKSRRTRKQYSAVYASDKLKPWKQYSAVYASDKLKLFKDEFECENEDLDNEVDEDVQIEDGRTVT